MYKMPANSEQSMAVFFLCILLAVVMAVGLVVYVIWKKYCQTSGPKEQQAPPINQSRQNSRSMSGAPGLPTSAEQYTEESSDGEEETGPETVTTSSSAMYTFQNEGVRCFNHIKPNAYRSGELFAHPSSYRQNLSLVGRNLKTVEEVEEGMDSPPSYEELFPSSVSSSLLADEDAIYLHLNGSADKRGSLT